MDNFNPAEAATRSFLKVGETLKRGQSLSSPEGKVKFTLLSDKENGDLVARNQNGALIFSAKLRTSLGVPPDSISFRKMWRETTKLIMQDDGNLVLYAESTYGGDRGPGPAWSSNTAGKGNANSIFQLQDDGSAVVMCDGKEVWRAPLAKK